MLECQLVAARTACFDSWLHERRSIRNTCCATMECPHPNLLCTRLSRQLGVGREREMHRIIRRLRGHLPRELVAAKTQVEKQTMAIALGIGGGDRTGKMAFNDAVME